jgi:translation initiation factor 3 subunit C
MFSLDVEAVSALISKMIINDELQATIDRTTQLVLLDRHAPGLDLSRLDYLAGQYSDKVAAFVEGNEKLYEAKCVQLGRGEPNISNQTSSRQQKSSQGKKSKRN